MATLANAKKFDAFSTDPRNLTILGWDVDMPEGFNHHTYQPKRNAQIKREKERMDELVTAIKAAKAVVQPVRVCKLKVGGEERQVVGIGRRRTIALRIVNEDQKWLDENNGGQPILLPLMLLDANDPLMFEKIRAENSGRLDADPLDTAAEIATTLAGMDQKDGSRYATVAAMYGKDHQFARAMEKLHNNGSDEVKKALKKGPGAKGGIGLVSAQEIATLATHEEQDKLLAEAVAAGDTSTKAIKGRKSVAKGNKTKGDDGASRRKDREVNKCISGLRLLLAAAKNKEERSRYETALDTLLWAMGEAYDTDGGKELHDELRQAILAVESTEVSEKEGEKAEERAEREAEKDKAAKKKGSKKKAA